MSKPVFVFFRKSHIETYTRKDGSVVNAHDNKVQKITKHRELAIAHKKHGDAMYDRGENGADDHLTIGEAHNKAADMLEHGHKDAEDISERCMNYSKSQPAPKERQPKSLKTKVAAKTEAPKDWRDEENWHTRTQMKFKTLTDESLKYIIKDATEAAEISEKRDINSKKAGQYRDEVHYASAELRARRGNAAKK